MISEASAEFFAPIVLSLLEAGVEKLAPKLAGEAKKYLPTVDKVICALLCEDPAKITSDLLAFQYDAIDRAVTAQINAQG